MRIRASKAPPLSSISNPYLAPSAPQSPASSDRCAGLDLLVLAVIEVFGDRALDAQRIGSNGIGEEEKGKREEVEKQEEEMVSGVEAGSKGKPRKRQLATPSRFHDSVMQPWKRSTRRRVVKKKKGSD